jgi:hypothetical protein
MGTFFIVDKAGAVAAVAHIHSFPTDAEVAGVVEQLGGNAPDNYVAEFKSRGEKIDAAGREWCYISADADIQPGMVELGLGRWGFES